MDKNVPIIVISGPSGSGKSTIFKRMLKQFPELALAISATTRDMREGEVNGEQYHFLSKEAFFEKVKNDEMLEFKEVYPGTFYGTFKSEIDRICGDGHIPLLEIDVEGALNIKGMFADKVHLIFIDPPSLQALEDRLLKRGTENMEKLRPRLERASYEISLKNKFETIVVNDDLELACQTVAEFISKILNK